MRLTGNPLKHPNGTLYIYIRCQTFNQITILKWFGYIFNIYKWLYITEWTFTSSVYMNVYKMQRLDKVNPIYLTCPWLFAFHTQIFVLFVSCVFIVVVHHQLYTRHFLFFFFGFCVPIYKKMLSMINCCLLY